MPHRSLLVKAALVLCLGLALGAAAQAQDITGAWDFTATLTIPPCTWTGPAQFTQGAAGAISGSGNLALTSGDLAQCQLPAIAGSVTGQVTGSTVQFGLATAAGPVTFNGTIDGSGQTMSGQWSLLSLTGSWNATLQAPVPTLAEWGAIAMLALLLAAGIYVLRRRPTPVA